MISVRSVAFWLNVFIPRDIVGLTVTVPTGPHAGKTALDGSARLLTDQRAFSSDPRASARMQSHITIDVSGSEPGVTVVQRADWAITCDREHGEVICRARATTRGMTADVIAMDPVRVRLECAARHPCPVALPALEELRFHGMVVYWPDARELSIDFMVGLFPAFEGYAAMNDGPPTILFRHAPPPGIAASPSARGAKRRIRTVVDDRDGDARLS